MRVQGTVRTLEYGALKTLVLHGEGEDASGQADSLRGQAGDFVKASRAPIDHVQ